MVSAVVDPAGAGGGPIRVVSLYGPNGRVVGSPFFEGKLRWYDRLDALAARGLPPDRAAAPRRRLQHRADRRRRLGCGRRPRRHPRLRARARGVPGAPARLGPGRRLPGPQLPSPDASPGGTTGPATSTRTSACGSITSSRPRRSRRGSSGPRSTARRARARRSRRTMPRSWSTSTLPAVRSIRTGPARCRGSRPGSRPARR